MGVSSIRPTLCSPTASDLKARLQKPCYSNPIVQFIIPERMTVLRGPDVLDFIVLPNAFVVCLESDSGPSVSFDEQDEKNPNML